MKRRIRLRGINGQVEGKTWDSDNILRAGRLATLEIVLEDSSVSRRHAEVRLTEKGWRVRDLGSTNGTYLNGQRVLSPSPLKHGDQIKVGSITQSERLSKYNRLLAIEAEAHLPIRAWPAT